MKYSRRSSVIVNVVPVYHKEAQIIAYAADKAVLLFCMKENRTLSLMAHTDTVTVLRFHSVNSFTLLSAGLDGKIIHWDIQTGQKIQQTDTQLPIIFLQDSFIAHELKSNHVLRKYKSGYKDYEIIMEDKEPIQFSMGGSDSFMACITSKKLLLHWHALGSSTSFTFSDGCSQNGGHQFTSVAAHPTEFTVATGNRMGEIFIWYRLAIPSSAVMNIADWLDVLDPHPDLLDEEGDRTHNSSSNGISAIRLDLSDSEFQTVRQAVLSQYQSGQSLAYCPVHPSRVHRTVLHWHCQLVQSLCFTPTGCHLLSGGLERVLVKWDMTECLGGPRQRRFLPRLAAPIRSIDSPGGVSEDTIIIVLSNNEFHVVTGALNSIYSHQGFTQFPSIWRRLSNVVDYMVPRNLLVLSDSSHTSTSASVVLTNGAMGNLQLVKLDSCRLEVQKLDVTRQSIVPRAFGSTIPVTYSEVLLTATVCSAHGGSWLVTYERIVPDCLKLLDDQARITWWKSTSENTELPRFDPTETFSLSHLNCRATDMDFVQSSDLYVYLLLADTRLMVWQHRPESVHTTHLSQWSLQTCRILHQKAHKHIPGGPRLTVFPCPTDGSLLILFHVGITVKLFPWSDAIGSGRMNILSNFKLRNIPTLCDQFTPLSTVDKAVVMTARRETAVTGSLVVVGVRVTPSIKIKVKLPTTVLVTLILDCSTKVSGKHALRAGSLVSDVNPVCYRAHPSKPLLAVGLISGEAIVMSLDQSGDHSAQFHIVQKLPSVSAHPLCDRRAMHRGGANRRHSVSKATTKLLALDFLNSITNFPTEVKLVGLVETTVGRERGRRDLIVYGSSPGASNQTNNLRTAKVETAGNILKLVDVAPTPCLPAVHQSLSGRKRHIEQTDLEIEDALRQVSRYPLITAPAPEQLLRQLMSKPDSDN